jgi:PAS domain S-box-containing protein
MAKDIREKTLLIVDDEPSNIKLLAAVLRDEYRLIVASSGSEALRLAISKKRPDLILLDIMMPDMDGYTVCRRLKNNEKTRHIPIIFITAKTEIESENRGFELGAVDYITKPFCVSTVRARVRTHLELKHHHDMLEFTNQQLAELIEKVERNAKERESANIELNQILLAATDGLCVVGNDFNILRINDKFLEVTQSKNTDGVGRLCHEITGFDRCHSRRCSLRRILNGEKRIEYEIQKKNAQGLPNHYLLTASAFNDAQGHLLGIVYNIKDITGLKKAAEALLQREKLEVVLQMAGAVSHEFIQPIQIILTCVQLLLSSTQNRPTINTVENRKKLITIKEQVNRLSAITAKLKSVMRYETKEYVEGERIVDLDKASAASINY